MIKTFVKHRPVDRSDPGFTIPGHTLRWISGRVSENNPGRIWMILRKSELPPDLIKYLEQHHPGAFREGDTIRRGDLVLSYASESFHKDYKAEKVAAAKELQQSLKRTPKMEFNQTAAVTDYETSKVSNEMVERFRKSNKED